MSLNPIVFALRHPITVMVAIAALVVGSGLAAAAHEGRHLPQPQPAGHLRRPALRRHGPRPDGRADHQLLRVSLPLHQRHPSRRIAERPGRRADEAVLPSRHRHGPGHGRDGRLRQPLAGLHAAGHGAAVHHALRHRQRPGRLPGAVQRDARASARSRTRRCSRSGRCSPACRACRRRRRSAAISAPSSSSVDPDRLRSYNLSPDDVVAGPRHPATPSARPATSASRTRCRSCRSTRWSVMPKDLGNIPLRPGENVYLRDVATDRGQHRHPHRLRPGQRPAGRVHAGHQAGRRFDAVGGQRGQGEPAARCRRSLPEDIDVRFEFDQSPYVTSAMWGVGTEGLLGAVLTGLMVLLFLRDWRSVIVVVLNIPFALLARRRRPVADGADDQPDDAGRPGPGGRHPGGCGHRRGREHPHAVWTRPPSVGAGGSARQRGNGRAALAGHAVRPGGVHSVVLHGRGGPGLFVPLSLAVGFAMIAVLFPVQHLRAGAVGLAAAPPSRRPDAAARGLVLVRPAADRYARSCAGCCAGDGWSCGVPGFGRARSSGWWAATSARRSSPRSIPASSSCACRAPTARASSVTEEIALEALEAIKERRRAGQRRDLRRLRRPDPVELPHQHHVPVDGRAGGSRPARGPEARERVSHRALKEALRGNCRTPGELVRQRLRQGGCRRTERSARPRPESPSSRPTSSTRS